MLPKTQTMLSLLICLLISCYGEASSLHLLKSKTTSSVLNAAAITAATTSTTQFNTYFLLHLNDIMKKNKCEMTDGSVSSIFDQNCMSTAKKVMRMMGIHDFAVGRNNAACFKKPHGNAIYHFRAEKVGGEKHEWVVACWGSSCVTISSWERVRGAGMTKIEEGVPGKSKVGVEMGIDADKQLCHNTYYEDVSYSEKILDRTSNDYKVQIDSWLRKEEAKLSDHHTREEKRRAKEAGKPAKEYEKIEIEAKCD